MNERGEQPGFVPPNEGGSVSRGPLEQSLPPEMKIEGIEPKIIPDAPLVDSAKSPIIPDRPEIRALSGFNRSDLQAALEDAEFRVGKSRDAELEEAQRDQQAAKELLERLDAATARKNTAQVTAVPSTQSSLAPEVVANLEEKLAAQRVAHAESHQRMVEQTGPAQSQEGVGMTPEEQAAAGWLHVDPELGDNFNDKSSHGGRAGIIHGGNRLPPITWGKIEGTSSHDGERESESSIEINPETGPLAEARKLDDARERYASTMRSQKKWFGAASSAEVEAARKDYIEQSATALTTAVADIKKKYEGQDLQNPELQTEFRADLLRVTTERRASEEQVLREAMRDGQHRRILDEVRTIWKKQSKARMVVGGGLTALGMATTGTPISLLAYSLRGVLTGVGTGVTLDAAAQTIRKDFGDTRELKPEYIKQLRQRISSADSKDKVAAKSELERLVAAHTMQQVENGAKEFGVQDRGILKWKHKDETGKQLLEMYDESIRTQQEQEISFHQGKGKSMEDIVKLHLSAVIGEGEVLHEAYIKRIKSDKKWNAAIGAASVIAGSIVAALGVTHAVKAAQHATGMMQSAHDAKDQTTEALQKAMAASADGHPPVPPSSLPFGTATPDAMGLHAAPMDTAQVSTQHVVEQASGHPFGDASPDAIGLHSAPIDTAHQTIADASDHPFGNGTPDAIGRYSTHLAPETMPSDALHVNPTEVPKVGSESLHFLGDTAHQTAPSTTTEFHNPFAPDTSKDFHNPFTGEHADLAGKPESIDNFQNPFAPDAVPGFHNPFTSVGHSEIEHAKTVAALAGNAVEHVEVAQSGDSVWSLTEKFVDHQFPNLSAEQRTWMIDSIKDKIVAHPELANLKDADHLEIGAKVNFDKLGIDFTSVAEKATHLSPEITKGIHEHLASHVDAAASVTPEHVPDVPAQTIQDIPRALRDTPIMYQDAHGKLVEMGSHLESIPDVATAITPDVKDAFSQYDAAFDIWAMDVKPDALRTAIESLRALTIHDAMEPGKIESVLGVAKADDPMFEERLGVLLRGVLGKMTQFKPTDSLGAALETLQQAQK